MSRDDFNLHPGNFRHGNGMAGQQMYAISFCYVVDVRFRRQHVLGAVLSNSR